MKTPLRYQITEFDCGSVSLVNCITYLFEREHIPAELIKAINTYTLDCYDEHGNLGQKGTSREAVKFLTRWICDFARTKDFHLRCEYMDGKSVTLKKIEDCVKAGGCVNLRTYQEVEHYVTVTNVDNKFVYLFDPYFNPASEYENNPHITADFNHPTQYNRIVDKKYFNSTKEDEFCLGPIAKREIVLLTTY